MARAFRVLSAGEAHGPSHDTLIIDSETRRGLQTRAISVRGLPIDIDLPPPVLLRTDDIIVLDSGELIDIVAAPEALFEVRAADLATLARIAWALGDRHVPVQVLPNRVRLRADPAMRALIAGAGGKITSIEAPFEPEGGAYAIAHHDRGEHAHRHDHSHPHGPDDHTHGRAGKR